MILRECLITGCIALALALPSQAAQTARTSDGTQVYWVEQLAEGLKYPSSMAWLPNGDMLILEREGGLRIVRQGRLDPRPIAGTPAAYMDVMNGLKDLVLDPDYPRNDMLYILLCEGTYEHRHAAVYRARFGGGERLENVERIFRSRDEVGGVATIATRMVFLEDKTLLVGVSEDHHAGAQDLGSDLGKVLRINRDGSVPADNPFLKTPGALPEIWTYGHRVQMGLYQDPESHEVWEVETGPLGGDELNLLKPGHNYGWAKVSWGFGYNNSGLDAPGQVAPGVDDPVLIWMPSQDPAGITRYMGSVYPLWNGDYFVGHLPTKQLERLRIEQGQVVLQERMLTDLKERIRDIKVGPDGYLYLLTDHVNGRLLRLQPGPPPAESLARVAQPIAPPPQPEIATGFNADEAKLGGAGDPVKGKQEFLKRCASCHSIGKVIKGGAIGPDLTNVYGSLMGHKAGFVYSKNMADAVFEWNFTKLNRFLTNPQGFVPDTKMTAPPIEDVEIRRELIGFLKQQSSKGESQSTMSHPRP